MSAPTARTPSRSAGRMNLRLNDENPLWVLIVMTLIGKGWALVDIGGKRARGDRRVGQRFETAAGRKGRLEVFIVRPPATPWT